MFPARFERATTGFEGRSSVLTELRERERGRKTAEANAGFEPWKVPSKYRSGSTATGDTATRKLSGRNRCREHSRVLFVRDVFDGWYHRQDLNLQVPGEAAPRLDGRHVWPEN